MDHEEDDVRLSQSSGHVTDALDEIAEFLYVFTAEGELLYWNDALSEITGYTDDKIATMGPADFFTDDDRDRISAAITRVRDDKCVCNKTTHNHDKQRFRPRRSGGPPSRSSRHPAG